MHSLLKRQLRKYLPESYVQDPGLGVFLEAIEKSYDNYDDKLSMMQRASTISSNELYEANQQLRKEAVRQKNILASLEKAIGSLTIYLDDGNSTDLNDKENFNAEHLAKSISKLAAQMAGMTAEKDKLLRNLEIQNESLNNYAHMVSHDLKSPIRNINALMNWIQAEEKEKFSEESKENCTLISQNLEKMDKLINGILYHATLGKTDEKRIMFAIEDLLNEIEENIEIPENIQIVHVNEFPTISFEKSRIEQLFKNLITNAIAASKDKEQGLVRIEYIEDPEFWKFKVSDNGKGIAKRHQEGIFEMFKKLENDGNTIGIGLAISKKIVDFHNGKLWMESEENQGATFYFTLKKTI